VMPMNYDPKSSHSIMLSPPSGIQKMKLPYDPTSKFKEVPVII
jgi:hypothetical protein